MTFLVVCILGLAGLAMTLRHAANAGASPMGLYAVFRGVAAALLVVGTFATLDWSHTPRLLAETWLVCLVGAPAAWMAGYAALRAVQCGHLGITWTVLRCAMLLPTLAAIAVWREVSLSPMSGTAFVRLAGVAVTTGALVMMGIDRRQADQVGHPNAGKGNWLVWMSLAFVSQGAFETCQVATRYVTDDEGRAFFLAVAFSVGFLCTLPMVRITGSRLGRKELGWGVLAGLFSLAGSGGRLFAIRDLGGLLVFPVSTVAVVLLVQMAGIGIWRERTGRWGVAGFLTALAGVLMLSLKL